MTADGKRLPIGEAPSFDDVTFAGTVVMRDGTHVTATGAPRWKKTAEARVWQTAAGPSVATELVDLATGKSLYANAGRTTRTFDHQDAGHVFGCDTELWLVGDDGQPRWRVAVDHLAGSRWAFTSTSLFVMREDRTFEERAFATGAQPSAGHSVGMIPGEPDPAEPVRCAGAYEEQPHERAAALESSYVVVERGKQTELVARDPSDACVRAARGRSIARRRSRDRGSTAPASSGRVRARSPWPIDRAATFARPWFDSTGELVAVVARLPSQPPELVVSDHATGHVASARHLDAGGDVAGFTGTCVLGTGICAARAVCRRAAASRRGPSRRREASSPRGGSCTRRRSSPTAKP